METYDMLSTFTDELKPAVGRIEFESKYKLHPVPREPKRNSPPTISYAAGFLFDQSLHNVVLIRKDRPAGFEGRWTTPGGKLELRERPIEAVRREFREETGVDVDYKQWHWVGETRRPGFKGHIFYAVDTTKCFAVRTMETELVRACSMAAIRDNNLNCTHDLRYLLEIAIARASGNCGPVDLLEHAG